MTAIFTTILSLQDFLQYFIKVKPTSSIFWIKLLHQSLEITIILKFDSFKIWILSNKAIQEWVFFPSVLYLEVSWIYLGLFVTLSFVIFKLLVQLIVWLKRCILSKITQLKAPYQEIKVKVNNYFKIYKVDQYYLIVLVKSGYFKTSIFFGVAVAELSQQPKICFLNKLKRSYNVSLIF